MSMCIFIFLHLFQLFKMNASLKVRRGAIKTLTRLIPCAQIGVKGTNGMLLCFVVSIWLLLFYKSFPFLFISIFHVILDTCLRLCNTRILSWTSLFFLILINITDNICDLFSSYQLDNKWIDKDPRIDSSEYILRYKVMAHTYLHSHTLL